MGPERKEPSWKIQLFGEPKAAFCDREAALPGVRRVSLLLIRIASSPNRVWSRDEICELLWPGEYIDIARDRLRQTLALLNKALKDAGGETPIEATKTTLRLSPELAEVDVERFSLLLRQASRNTDIANRITSLNQAIEIGEQPFAESFTEDWVRQLRESYAQELHQARIQLAHAYRNEGAYNDASKVLGATLIARPLDEQATLLQVQTLCDLDRRAEAASLIQSYKERLESELGMKPSTRFQREIAEVRTGEAESEEQTLPRIVWREVARPFTRFFGRESELAQLQDAFAHDGRRLITVTGLGGSGKTRLAVEYAQSAEGFWSQIVLLGLAELSNAEQVLHTLASIYDIGIQAQPQLLAQLSQRIGNGPVLLVLDNCEHLCPEIGELVASLLQACPGVHVLATSRVLLGLLGEYEFALPPLTTPSHSSGEGMELPAVRMLIERIRTTRPDCQISDTDVPTLLQICNLLEGIPLAIELAGSRAKVLSLRQMLEGFETGLDFLSSSYSNLPSRHRAMRNALEWSFNDLSKSLQDALIDLSVLAGSWTIDAAEAITQTSDAVQTIEELRSRSLLQSESLENEVRFRLLEVVRQFVQEKAEPSQTEAAKVRHMKHFADYAVTIARARQRGEEVRTSRLFRLALPDFRIAKQTAFSQAAEAREELTQLTIYLANFYEAMGNLDESARDLKRVIDEKLLPTNWVPYAVTFYSQILCLTADKEGMQQFMPELLHLTEASKDSTDLVARGNILCSLSFMAWLIDRKDVSEYILPLMVEHRHKLKPGRPLVMTSLNTANTMYHAGHIQEALDLYHELLKSQSEYGHLTDFAHVRLNLGRCYREQGRPEEGLELCVSALQKFEKTLNHSTLESLQEALACYILCEQMDEQDALAGQLLGFEQAGRRRLGAQVLLFEREVYGQVERTLSERLGDRFEAFLLAGAALNFDEACTLAHRLITT